MIEVRNLHKSFGKVKAVSDMTFEARDGEITGLLGPNGAGKTTTLRMLYSLLPPDEGDIRIDGLDPTKDAMAIKTTLGCRARQSRFVPTDLQPEKTFATLVSFTTYPSKLSRNESNRSPRPSI